MPHPPLINFSSVYSLFKSICTYVYNPPPLFVQDVLIDVLSTKNFIKESLVTKQEEICLMKRQLAASRRYYEMEALKAGMYCSYV